MRRNDGRVGERPLTISVPSRPRRRPAGRTGRTRDGQLTGSVPHEGAPDLSRAASLGDGRGGGNESGRPLWAAPPRVGPDRGPSGRGAEPGARAGGPDRHTCRPATINRDGSPHVTGIGALW